MSDVIRLISASGSDFEKMTPMELKDSIFKSEGRVIMGQHLLFAGEGLVRGITNSEVMFAFGADMVMLNTMDLDNNAHSVFLLQYHLVLVVKYRRQVFDDGISSRAKEIFEYIAPNYNITLEEWDHDKDHIHILFRAHPNTEISKFINAYKSASSRLLKKEFPQIRQKLWKEHFWSQSFCLITTGDAPIEVFKKYIESQGQRDRKRK